MAADFGLTSEVLSALRGVFRDNPRIEKVLIYGSRAMGTHRPNSDIDLTVVGDSLGATDLLALMAAVDALSLPYRVDLSIFHRIENNNLRDHICRAGKRLV